MAPTYQSRRSALLIGINNYGRRKEWNLGGCIPDVEATEEFLVTRAGIPQENITRLLSPLPSPADPLHKLKHPLPTFDNVKAAFEKIAQEAEAGDFIYIHYSGHGFQTGDAFHRETTDDLTSRLSDIKNTDEGLVLVNSALDHVKLLYDFELAYLLKQIADKGAVVTLVLDSCHSGGATRGDGVRVRSIDKLEADDVEDWDRPPIPGAADLRDALRSTPGHGDGRGGRVIEHWLTAAKGINFLAACQPSQKALDGNMGAFTYNLQAVINSLPPGLGRDQLSCGVVFNLVAKRMTIYTGSMDPVFGGQHNTQFFGSGSVMQHPVKVDSRQDMPDKTVKLKLNVGAAHEVLDDDIFIIFHQDNPLASLADYTAPLATCKVEEKGVNEFSCYANIIAPDPLAATLSEVKVGCKAIHLREVIQSHILRSNGVHISSAAALDEAQAHVLRNLLRQEGGRLLELKEDSSALFKVVAERDTSYTIRWTPNGRQATVKGLRGPQAALSCLNHLSVYYNLFHLARDDANGSQDAGISIRKVGYVPTKLNQNGPGFFNLRPGEELPSRLASFVHIPEHDNSVDILHGQSLVLEVHNKTENIIYVEILNLEPSWKAQRAYPSQQGVPIQLEKQQKTYFLIDMVPSDSPHNATQPDNFDRFVVLGTSRKLVHFRHSSLPPLQVSQVIDSGGHQPTVLNDYMGDDERAGLGRDLPGWFVQHFDARVVA